MVYPESSDAATVQAAKATQYKNLRTEGRLDICNSEMDNGSTGVENKITASEISINIFNNFSRML